jgi:putative transposase
VKAKLRILTVVDTFSRFSPAVVLRFRFRAPDVVEVLERVCSEMGYPASIRVDQGCESISRDLDLWACTRDVTLDFSRPGKPIDNAFIEVLQRQTPGGVPEPALVDEPRRRGAKMRGLA